MTSAAAIRAHAVTKRYPTGTVALRELTVAIEMGQLVALVGPSGAGKTTLFRLCNGAVKPTAGEMEVLGVCVAAARGQALQRLRRRVAVVHQSHNLVGSLSVLNNVLIGRLGRVSILSAVRRAVWTSEHERLEAVELLDQLGIADKLLSRVDDLSGGQKQRVAIARALIQRPELLLADEPVASVDAETATVILDLLARTCRERGTTAVVSLHQHQYIERYCDRILELRAGALVRSAQVSGDGLRAEGKVLVAP